MKMKVRRHRCGRQAGPRCLASTGLLALLLAPATAPAGAQLLQGTLDGSGTDASDAVIPGAQVTITQMETGATRSAAANEVGFFSFPAVSAGPYSVEVRADGFQAYRQTGVRVSPNQVVRVDVSLGACPSKNRA